MIMCQKCGLKLPGDLNFCVECGTPLNGMVKSKKSNKKVFILISALLVIVSVVFFAKGYIFDKFTDPNPISSTESIITPQTDRIFEEVAIKETYSEETSMDEDVVLGDINNSPVTAILPAELFEEAKKVILKSAEKSDYAPYDETQFVSAVVPFNISVVGNEHTRLDKPVTLRFNLSADFMRTLDYEDDLRISYYDGNAWHYYKPDKIDMANGIVEYNTYHFSPYGFGKVTDVTIKSEMARQLAIADWKRNNDSKTVHNASKALVAELITTTTGITDSAVLNKIIENVVKQNDYGSLIVSLQNKDTAGFSTKMSEVVAKTISKVISSEEMASQFKVLGEKAGKYGAYAQVAGALLEGDAKEAAKAISNALLDGVVVGKVFKAGIEVISTSIDCWKNSKIEDMFLAYQVGAEGGMFSYSVDKLNFEGLWGQSGPITRQIYIDAINNYCYLEDRKPDSLAEKELQKIRADAKQSVKDQFDARIKAQTEIKTMDDDYLKMFAAFEELDLLTRGFHGYEESMSLEQRINRLMVVKNSILSLTDCHLIMRTLPNEGEIPISVVTMAMRYWYNDADHNQAIQYLIDEGYIKQKAGEKFVSLTITPTTAIVGEKVSFLALVDNTENNSDYSYTWYLGEGDGHEAGNLAHTQQSPVGVNQIKVEVYDKDKKLIGTASGTYTITEKASETTAPPLTRDTLVIADKYEDAYGLTFIDGHQVGGDIHIRNSQNVEQIGVLTITVPENFPPESTSSENRHTFAFNGTKTELGHPYDLNASGGRYYEEVYGYTAFNTTLSKSRVYTWKQIVEHAQTNPEEYTAQIARLSNVVFIGTEQLNGREAILLEGERVYKDESNGYDVQRLRDRYQVVLFYMPELDHLGMTFYNVSYAYAFANYSYTGDGDKTSYATERAEAQCAASFAEAVQHLHGAVLSIDPIPFYK